MLKLNSITKLVKKRKTVGRGGSRGGTSGKGGKGQTARSGGLPRIGFEGGQMPLFRRLPKRGFNNYDFQHEVVCVNLQQLNDHFTDGDIVDRKELVTRGLVDIKNGAINEHGTKIKVLGNGQLKKKLTVHADAFSKSAREMIGACGGEALVNKEK